jgi:hypothetical protein
VLDEVRARVKQGETARLVLELERRRGAR